MPVSLVPIVAVKEDAAPLQSVFWLSMNEVGVTG
jgi:hypothetical protein